MTDFTIIPSPLTIRSVRGNKLVHINSKNEPVSLVRQTGPSTLDVHLRDGTSYEEKFSLEEMVNGGIDRAILSMAGLNEYTLFIKADMFFRDVYEEGELIIDDDTADVVNSFVKSCYPPNSYINMYVTKIANASIQRKKNGEHHLYICAMILCRDEDIEVFTENLEYVIDTERNEFGSSIASVFDAAATHASIVEAWKNDPDVADKTKIPYDFETPDRLFSRLYTSNVSVTYAEK